MIGDRSVDVELTIRTNATSGRRQREPHYDRDNDKKEKQHSLLNPVLVLLRSRKTGSGYSRKFTLNVPRFSGATTISGRLPRGYKSSEIHSRIQLVMSIETHDGLKPRDAIRVFSLSDAEEVNRVAGAAFRRIQGLRILD